MDGTGKHYAKWNKPGSERQIPYDLTSKWNLINKTSKQAKYNQRHWNKEQTDSNQRGEEDNGGKKGKGHQRTCIKDHGQSQSGGWDQGWEVEISGMVGSGGGKMEKTVLEQQFLKKHFVQNLISRHQKVFGLIVGSEKLIWLEFI